MIPFQPTQEYNDLRWGTGTPIALKVGLQFVQLRARGTCSLVVQDAQKLQQQVPDPDALTAHVRALLSGVMEDTIGTLGMHATNVAQLTTVSGQTVQAFQANLEPKFKELGLQLKAVSIEAIESV